jgi:integrase
LAIIRAWSCSGDCGDGSLPNCVDLPFGANYRNRHFRRVCKAAGIGRYNPKDLRDTFASQLLTSGIQLGYVSVQLGHTNSSVTAQHYARWVGGDKYRRPLEVQPGEVPADMLARLDGEKSHQSPTTAAGGPSR